MTRELLLLRHGKSDWGVACDDFQRPLKDRGKRGAQRMGIWLQQQALMPDLVMTSPAERALVTAHKCGKAMGLDARRLRQDKRIYLADRDELLAVLADCPPEAQRVMLVGHNPGLEQLLQYLVAAPVEIPPDGKVMPTATLAQLQMPDDWRRLQAGQARLLQLVRAKSLAEKFPFPSAQGQELRDRPAYYYTQSAVIPYRIDNGQLEILIIRSSSNKHWVVPKGIAEPGHSKQESAAKEAREEAGIEGEVGAEALGDYRYAKWGATCSVSVYPMLVTRQLADEEWQERHRGRQWVAANKAAALLQQKALGPMVKALEQQLSQRGLIAG